MSDVAKSAQGAFKREVDTQRSEALHFRQHQTTGSHSGKLGVEWRQSASDQIRVDEVDHAGVVWEEIASERRLAGTVGSSDDDAPGAFG
jgi:hypothetical protein